MFFHGLGTKTDREGKLDKNASMDIVLGDDLYH
jgi:hypothetical protein